MRLLIAFVLGILMVGQAALAGEVVGNGGNAVLIDGKPYLLDLVEAGLEKNPVISNLPVPAFIQERTLKKLGQRKFDLAPLNQALARILLVDEELARSLLKAVEMHNWFFTDQPLTGIVDDDSAVALPKIQLAIRRVTTVVINSVLWVQMDAANQAALVLHEVIYSLLKPEKIMENGEDLYIQRSRIAREINALLFSPNLDWDSLNRLAAEHLPLEQFPRHDSYRKPYYESDSSIFLLPSLWVEHELVGTSNGGGIRVMPSISSDIPNNWRARAHQACQLGYAQVSEPVKITTREERYVLDFKFERFRSNNHEIRDYLKWTRSEREFVFDVWNAPPHKADIQRDQDGYLTDLNCVKFIEPIIHKLFK